MDGQGVCASAVVLTVATCFADVKDIAYVINYDMPNGIEDYIHRCVAASLVIAAIADREVRDRCTESAARVVLVAQVPRTATSALSKAVRSIRSFP